MTRGALLYLASLGAHAALAVGVASLDGKRAHEAVSIALVEAKKPPKPEAPPPPPPVLPDPPQEKAKAKVAPPKAIAKAAEAPPPVAEAAAGPASQGAIPDFGVSLSGGTGGGLAMPAAAAPRASAEVAATKPVQRTTKVLAAAPAPEETCSEPPKKPKVLTIAQPTYTRAARDAEIAGRVRVEVTVDATGRVSGTRVLEGLGYGLDEEALAAAKNATFEPGTRCGHAAAATFVVAMRFSL